ncbi:pilus assembly protein [Primorskyibacter aestuariivivens]|uniref:TadE/TadG family type IV pilus assembly protein n=1 Tax=Primorskyibacter aestuariivivens TaxID=1888912 RepID=UPI002301E392|nr:TadE/TadG family type IV pilus assembly protein [Primorskyibacter aestuariivivens]MDA7427615.1 pilus assembly protein [Primorskyibacter aestuariivivens]
MNFLRQPNIAKDESGAVLVETLIAIPVLTIATFGLLEFGNMLWQREQLQVGVRDAARYLSRCRQWASGTIQPNTCDRDVAERIAFFGDPRIGQGSLRVPGWDETSELVILPTTLFTSAPTVPTAGDTIVVYGEVTYQGSPVFNAVLSAAPKMGYTYEVRYQGW